MNADAARTLYTWDDYRSWPDTGRWEILGGQAYAMTPAPAPRHQVIQRELTRQVGNFLAGKRCQVFPAPVDVKLSDTDTVQPDLAVVCTPKQVRPTHIEGPPALVVEILSPSTALFDRGRKLDLYARSGVREVWLVTPYPSCIEVLVLDGSTYRLIRACGKEDEFRSRFFPGLRLDLMQVFRFPLEPGERIAMVKEGRPPYATRKGRRA